MVLDHLIGPSRAAHINHRATAYLTEQIIKIMQQLEQYQLGQGGFLPNSMEVDLLQWQGKNLNQILLMTLNIKYMYLRLKRNQQGSLKLIKTQIFRGVLGNRKHMLIHSP